MIALVELHVELAPRLRPVPDRSWISDVADSYDRVAAPYADLTRNGLEEHPLEQALLDSFAARTRQAGTNVLDAGCGPGILSRDLARHGLSVTAIDLSLRMLRTARSIDSRTAAVAASLTELPFASESFDGILCFYVLHHVPDDDLQRVIAELARVLRPGGAMMLAGHTGDSTHLKTEGYGGHPMRVLVAKRGVDIYTRLLRDTGLTLDATIAMGPDEPATSGVWLAHRPD